MTFTAKVITQHVRPPIPTRAYDWCAYLEDEEENGPYGWGETEKEAVLELIELTKP